MNKTRQFKFFRDLCTWLLKLKCLLLYSKECQAVFFAETFRAYFCWDILVICLTVVLKLGITVFISLYFHTL